MKHFDGFLGFYFLRSNNEQKPLSVPVVLLCLMSADRFHNLYVDFM